MWHHSGSAEASTETGKWGPQRASSADIARHLASVHSAPVLDLSMRGTLTQHER